MPSKRINKELNNKIYFVTLTIKNWHYIFDRHNRWKIIIDSLKYCIKHKELTIYGYVLMLNHIHLIFKSKDAIGFIRDFKKYTSKELFKNLEQTEPKVAKLFISKEGSVEIWKKTNMPIIIETEKIYWQKKNYIENNPVMKGYVEKPEHWIHSSAFEPNLIDFGDIYV
jgi:putative transposase